MIDALSIKVFEDYLHLELDWAEEAPSLGRPALVMRDATELPEGMAVAAGTLKLVGTDEDVAYRIFRVFPQIKKGTSQCRTRASHTATVMLASVWLMCWRRSFIKTTDLKSARKGFTASSRAYRFQGLLRNECLRKMLFGGR